MNKNIYIKWSVIVILNSVLGFFLGFFINDIEPIYSHLTGMIMGVFTWFLIYLSFDLFLQNNGYKNASRKLYLCAALRIPLQLTFYPDFIAGMFAVFTAEALGINLNNGFLSAYFLTVFTGFYLSIICSFLYLILSIPQYLKKVNNKTARRWIAILLCLASVGLCFLYAAFRYALPAWWQESGGGIPYVVFWILLCFALYPVRRALIPICIGVVLLTTALEFMQLADTELLASIRSTKLGLAWLGHGFDWADIPPYFIGGLLSFIGLFALTKTSHWKHD